MAKTKNVVIDQQSEDAAREQRVKNYSRDINRLTKEVNYQVFDALTTAMNQLKGDRKVTDAILDSELYCDMWELQSVAFSRVVKHDRKAQQYQRMEMDELLKQLYQRMQTMYNYGACKGRSLKGIAWTENNGRFVIHLRDCVINMEHSICDESRLSGWEGSVNELSGNLYAIGYDSGIDCDDPNGDYYKHYEEALNFLCELNTANLDNTEHRDVALYHRSWHHKELLRDTLATLDMISDLANEKK